MMNVRVEERMVVGRSRRTPRAYTLSGAEPPRTLVMITTAEIAMSWKEIC
jgi:hypothetical protein